MSEEKIIFEVVTTAKGLKVVQKDTEKLAKSTDKVDNSQKKATKSGNQYHKMQKGVGQMGANNTKNFSKMSQTLGGGGSSGLVAAYATLAANVFAASAAFNALSRAAEFENLKKGLSELGAQSGRTLSVMADGLREVTGGAISAEEAMRGAALGVSGGFGGEQLEGLAKIAKGASITLGRSLPDAFDRLTRGAIKLEPEILDELGIMVRLDDAVENYAAEIGKAGGALTQMERRQAFMNEILSQGEAKFGEIADAVDTDVYARLGATFADLNKNIFNFINNTLGLEKVVGVLADNTGILLGVMVLFASTIAGKMLPGLSNMAASSAKNAERLQGLADAAGEAAIGNQKLANSLLGQGKIGSKAYKNMSKGLEASANKTETLRQMTMSLNKTEGQLMKTKIFASKAEELSHKKKLKSLATEKALLLEATRLEAGRGLAAVAANNAASAANAAKATAGIVAAYASGNVALTASLGALWGTTTKYTASLTANTAALTTNRLGAVFTGKAMIFLKGAIHLVSGAAKIAAVSLLAMMGPIAVLLIAGAALFAVFSHIVNTKEQKAYTKGMKALNTTIDNVAKSAEKYAAAMDSAMSSGAKQTRMFEIQSGFVGELNALLVTQIKLRKEANATSTTGDIKLASVANQNIKSDGTEVTGVHGSNKKSGQLTPRINTSDNKAAEAGLMASNLSAEALTATAILESGITSSAQVMSEELRKAFTKPFKNAEEAAALVASAVQVTQDRLKAIGPSATGLSTAMKEASKESSKFMTSFQQKTKFDALATSTLEVKKNIIALVEANKLAFGKEAEDDVLIIGRALTDIGTKTGMMIANNKEGLNFREVQMAAGRVTKEMQDMTTAGTKFKKGTTDLTPEYKRQQGLLEDQNRLLGTFGKEYDDMVDVIGDAQRLEMTKKSIMKAQTMMIKGMSKFKKVDISLAGKENSMMVAKLKTIQLIANAERKILETTHQTIVTERDTNGVMVESITHAELMNKSLAEQLKIVDDGHITQKDLFALRNAEIAKLKEINEIAHQGNIQENAANVDKAEAEMASLARAKELSDIQMKNSEQAAKIEKFQAGGAGINGALDPIEAARIKVEAAQKEAEFAFVNNEVQKSLIHAKGEIQKKEFDLLNKQIEVANKGLSETDDGFVSKIDNVKDIKDSIDKATQASKDILDANVLTLQNNVKLAWIDGIKAGMTALKDGSVNSSQLTDFIKDASTNATLGDDGKNTSGTTGDDKGAIDTARARKEELRGILLEAETDLNKLGPTGEAYGAVLGGFTAMSDGFTLFADSAKGSADKIEGVKQVIAGIGSIMAGASKAAVAGIDQQIKAEENRDGKSKESLKKIQALKVKKYQMEKKAFDQNKKFQIAEALISTYSGVAKGVAKGFPAGIPDIAMALGIGMAQVKAIQATQFGGSNPAGSAGGGSPASLSVGKRNNRVDTSMGSSAGELAYLRGSRGIGSNANNFTATGGAAGMKSYAAGGEILVGETGPETITPISSGYQVNPNDELNRSNTNVNFTINTIDSQGVEQFLNTNQGAIIGTIRTAANAHGQDFMEMVDTQAYQGEK